MADNFRKQGSTELETITLTATGLVNLGDLTNAKWFQRDSKLTLKVNAGTMVVLSSTARTLTFDPSTQAVGGVGAFNSTGRFEVYVRATWDDGDITRHPDKGYQDYIIDANFE